jgi:hypothetical protein
MKTSLKRKCALGAGFGLLTTTLLGHVVAVHQRITENAADSALTFSPAYAGFLDTVSTDITILDARNYLSEGSAREDDPVSFFAPKDAGGYCSLNHFYDPLDQTFGKGLSDDPPDSRVLEGTNSFAWASLSNSLGVPKHGLHPTNTWSWQNARYFEWLGLTASNKADRFTNLTKKGVGS